MVKEKRPDEDAYILQIPEKVTSSFVFSSPHSGRHYPNRFRRLSRLDEKDLRRSEDCFVDELFQCAPKYGAPLIKARFPRAYLDLNRDSNELDPILIADPLPYGANTNSERVIAGLGTVARVVATGMPIYGGQLPLAEVKARIEQIYKPYHRMLKKLLDEAKAQSGWAILIDCHSMPSRQLRGKDPDAGSKNDLDADIVLGDRFGTSCDPLLTTKAEEILGDLGYRISRNKPYAGGYCTDHYGNPTDGRHALQIELNRALYLDETGLAKTENFETLQRHMEILISEMTRMDLGRTTQLAAE